MRMFHIRGYSRRRMKRLPASFFRNGPDPPYRGTVSGQDGGWLGTPSVHFFAEERGRVGRNALERSS